MSRRRKAAAMASSLDSLLGLLAELSPEEQAQALDAAYADTAGMLWMPNDGPQSLAYLSPADELLYGGEAGGGKTDLLLGLALNEHGVSQIFRLQHNDRVAIVRRLAQIWLGTADLEEGAKPPGYNGNDHIWLAPRPCGVKPKRRPIIEFGALSDPNAWKHYQGRPADLKGWDELTQFTRAGYQTVNAWKRSASDQRTRIVGATNPPTTPEGLWVIDHWGPWLDDRHPNSAKEGELRYYATVDGEADTEVDASWRGEDKNGLEVLPVSRTFIRSTLADNPDLAKTGYASTLANLPKHLREALAEGKFRATFEDNELQVIPTDWIIAAQQRWHIKKAAFEEAFHGEELGPMTSMGVDCAGGGNARMMMAPWHGTFLDELKEPRPGIDLRDPRQQAAELMFWLRDAAQCNIDNTGGWGSGLASILDSNSIPYVLCNFAAESLDQSREDYFFVNKRTAYYWLFREALDPVHGYDLALPPDRELLQELSGPRFVAKRHKGRPAYALEPKENVEARLGRSTDKGDSCVLGWAEKDGLDNPTGRERFHPRSTPGESNRANSHAKARARAWRKGDRG